MTSTKTGSAALRVLAGVAGVTLGVGTLATPAFAAGETGYQILVNDHADKCIDVAGHSRVAGGVLHEWDCAHDSNNHNQHWTVNNTGGSAPFRAEESGLCMNDNGLRAQLTQEVCDGRLTEQWHWAADTAAGRLFIESAAGTCIALIPNTSANGTAIATDLCSNTSAKHWHGENTP